VNGGKLSDVYVDGIRPHSIWDRTDDEDQVESIEVIRLLPPFELKVIRRFMTLRDDQHAVMFASSLRKRYTEREV
jgi:hypothetical protein